MALLVTWMVSLCKKGPLIDAPSRRDRPDRGRVTEDIDGGSRVVLLLPHSQLCIP